MMYLRFVTCLAVGLFGVSLVLMTVYDALFQDWDVVRDIRLWAQKVARKHRTRYVMMDEERMNAARLNAPVYASRPSAYAAMQPTRAAAPQMAYAAPSVQSSRDVVAA